ncbi:MAG: DUF4395 family protein, partial [Anaerolineales bacterium]
YLLALGILTLTGAFSSRSFYDRLYSGGLSTLFPMGDIPAQGNPRKFGCGVGACLYILNGLGFLLGNIYLSLIPALVIIVLAYVAAFTQWCFASTLYNAIFRKQEKCC